MEKHIEILVDRKEYITKEEAYKTINEQYHEIGLDGYQDGIELMNRIAKLPAADVVEVRHGRWHRYSKGSCSYNGVIMLSDAFQCTICKESFWNKSNYCPNCGAKMNGGQYVIKVPNGEGEKE